MLDDDEPVPYFPPCNNNFKFKSDALYATRYKMGEVYVEVSKDEAEQLLEKAQQTIAEVESINQIYVFTCYELNMFLKQCDAGNGSAAGRD